MPELQNEELNEILEGASEPAEMRILNTDEERAVAAKILPILAAKANALADANRAKRMEQELKTLSEENAKMMNAELEKIREANKPPNIGELEKLLNQEYAEVTFKTRERGSNTERTFYIRELPQEAEERFVKILQKKIIPRLKEYGAMNLTDTGTMLQKIEKLMDAVPEVMDTMCEITAVALDPWGDEKIDSDWVRKNLSSYRITMVIQAQVAAGKLRDFFWQVFQNTPGLKTV